MEFLVTAFIILAMSFGMVVGVAVGVGLLCLALNSNLDILLSEPNGLLSGPPNNDPDPVNVSHPQPNYLGIFATLLMLTVVTVGLSRINFGGATNTSLAIVVATFKASLVALYFMHLKYERRLLLTVVAVPAFFFIALFVGLMPDLVTDGFNSETGERPGFGVASELDK